MNARQKKALAHALRREGIRVDVSGNDQPAQGASQHPKKEHQKTGKQVLASERNPKEHHAAANKNDEPTNYEWRVMLRNIWLRVQRIFTWFQDKSNPIIAFGTVVLGVIGVGGLVLTYETLREVGEEFRVSQRAYVTLGRKDGTIAEFVVPKDIKADAGIVVYFQNSGHLPAKFNWGVPDLFNNLTVPANSVIQFIHSPHNFGPMYRTRNKKTGSLSEVGAGDSIGGESQVVEDFGEVSREEMDRMSTANMIYQLNGVFEYCDELGTYRCRQFALYYQGVPYSAFRLVSEYDCWSNARTISHRDPDVEYLPACKTAQENDKRDNGLPLMPMNGR